MITDLFLKVFIWKFTSLTPISDPTYLLERAFMSISSCLLGCEGDWADNNYQYKFFLLEALVLQSCVPDDKSSQFYLWEKCCECRLCVNAGYCLWRSAERNAYFLGTKCSSKFTWPSFHWQATTGSENCTGKTESVRLAAIASGHSHINSFYSGMLRKGCLVVDRHTKKLGAWCHKTWLLKRWSLKSTH